MKKYIQSGVGVLIGVALVYFAFKDTNWGEVFASIRHVSPGWLVISICIAVASFFTRAQRWAYIVRVAQPVSFRHLFSATQIGFLVNFTIPARLGELVRALVLTRLTKIPFTKSVAMCAVDRIMDLAGLIAVMAVTLIGFPITRDVTIPKGTFGPEPIVLSAAQVKHGEVLAGIGLVALVAALVTLYLNQRLVLRISDAALGAFSKKLAEKVHGMIEHFAEGLHIFRRGADLAKSVLWSLATWGCFVLCACTFMQAFGITWFWYTPFVLQTLLAVFLIAPIMPGMVGQFHIPIVLAIVATSPQTTPSDAKAVAIVAHLLNLIPIIVSGLICLYMENLGLTELGRDIRHAEDDEAAGAKTSSNGE